MINTEQLSLWLITMESLTLFRGIQYHPVPRSLGKLCNTLVHLFEKGQGPDFDRSKTINLEQKRLLVRSWSEFIDTLVRYGSPGYPELNLYSFMAQLTLQDENPFTLALERAKVDSLSPVLLALAKADLEKLHGLARFDMKTLADTIADLVELPLKAVVGSETNQPAPGKPEEADINPLLKSNLSWSASVSPLADRIHTHGAGILGQHHAFIWKQGKRDLGEPYTERNLYPVLNADTVSLEDLSHYEEQRAVVMDNTRRFVEGKTANNLLLYGDRGTGKSATVKAVCRAFADRGLKLIEVRKRDLMHFESIAETLSGRGLRFVLFIDDLSFEETDDTFTGLKALLEGGLERRPANVVIYATSNRRHLVKEHFADRPTTAMAAEALSTGDVRAFDTMQEQLSLADRFGVTVVFTAPGQEEFLAIAEAIAERKGLLPPGADRQKFRENALRWERWFNGRSPRTAQQYVDWLSGGEGFPWE